MLELESVIITASHRSNFKSKASSILEARVELDDLITDLFRLHTFLETQLSFHNDVISSSLVHGSSGLGAVTPRYDNQIGTLIGCNLC